ncbi:MAG: ligase-associated DNA damage response endonuclease PdeM [Planctomycetota bacterium]|jgi:DNA ligase-associated metallophosphoesterase|nr:ligase-associated DNA damage response endonuclease PdeM [Planctomycetota bacterium]
MKIGTDPDAAIMLLPGRAALLPASATLLIADLHLGKAATFRKAGIPIPEGSAQRDLARLTDLVARHAVRRLLILGDLFHARTGCTDQVQAEFAATRAKLAETEVVLVLGNHDRPLGLLPASLGIDAIVTELNEPPLRFVHEPATTIAAAGRDLFTIGGHLHPTVSIRSPSGDRIADRCFVTEPATLVLPAFGSFTGGHRITPTGATRIWIARDDGVAEVSRLAASTPRRSSR